MRWKSCRVLQQRDWPARRAAWYRGTESMFASGRHWRMTQHCQQSDHFWSCARSNLRTLRSSGAALRLGQAFKPQASSRDAVPACSCGAWKSSFFLSRDAVVACGIALLHGGTKLQAAKPRQPRQPQRTPHRGGAINAHHRHSQACVNTAPRRPTASSGPQAGPQSCLGPPHACVNTAPRRLDAPRRCCWPPQGHRQGHRALSAHRGTAAASSGPQAGHGAASGHRGTAAASSGPQAGHRGRLRPQRHRRGLLRATGRPTEPQRQLGPQRHRRARSPRARLIYGCHTPAAHLACCIPNAPPLRRKHRLCEGGATFAVVKHR